MVRAVFLKKNLFFKGLEITMEVIKEQLTHQAIPLLLSLKRCCTCELVIANNLRSNLLEL